ncbi:MAG TPA: serine/threonine-protein kinase [Allocoleopsis sp.]
MMIGTILQNRYKILQTLKSGSFGDTFLAEDIHLPGNPNCLIKQLKQNAIPDVKTRFETEAIMLKELGDNHPQIPKLLARFEENNELYLVQEYIEGHTLKHEFENLKNPLTESEAIALISDLLSILKFVHSRNVVHRDVNPNNIMRRMIDNKLILIDFGAAKRLDSNAQSTIAIGTPGYMPPEQGIGKPELCSDIYAVGMLAIQFLTLTWPHQFTRNQKDEIDNPNFRNNINANFAKILDKMVCENSSDRYQSCHEILEKINPGKTVLIPPSVNYNFSKLLLGGLGGILIIILSVIFWPKNPSGKFLNYGEPITGELTEKKPIDPIGNVYFDEYVIEGKAGQNITINLNSDSDSDKFDPVLVLFSSQKEQLAINNDISPENLNSEINITLLYTGNYIVVVKTNKSTEKGKYTLKAKVN